MKNEKIKEFEKIFDELDKNNKDKVICLINELKKSQEIAKEKE